ncbi:hypothetical protein BUY75_02630 [Staphylococcus epidermidis]|uniref:hypothetical protein n=1 Tax=Staphylococcus epidermidis TaxID=1282 RepID=UPI000D1CA4A4|nr:hypothetical protein [Staphylococcus epidermidis]PTE46856.1 hypothetical protein BUY75_02630 [Staphylococcus epidermidis]
MNTLNNIKSIGLIIISNIIPLLFLIGLTAINVASYIGFGLVLGLFVTGITLVVIAIILTIEKSKAIPPQQ